MAKSKPQKLGTAPSTKAAAARMDLAAEMLKEAKDAGWSCFGSGGRVNCDAFLARLASEPEFAKKWTKEGGIPPIQKSKEIDAYWAAQIRRLNYKIKSEKVIPRSERSSQFDFLIGEIVSESEKIITNTDDLKMFLKFIRDRASSFSRDLKDRDHDSD